MQRANTNNLYNQINDLINKTYANYREFIEYKSLKHIEYPYMHFNELDDATKAFERMSSNLGTNILGDIMNINKKDVVVGNVYQNLKRSLYFKFYNYSGDEFSKVLVQGLKMQYYLTEYIEEAIRDFFKEILKSYCIASDDELIKRELIALWQDIEFKYSMSGENQKNHVDNMQRVITKQISNNKIGCFCRIYLDDLIKNTIDGLLKMSDEDLASDRNFSKAISLTILLRSIFMIIGDYKELIPYEEYYNEREKKETESKKLIREAFIMHYNDSMNEEIKRLAKNKIIDL